MSNQGLSKRLRWSPKSGGLGHCTAHWGTNKLVAIWALGDPHSAGDQQWGQKVILNSHVRRQCAICPTWRVVFCTCKNWEENMLARSIIAPFVSLAGPELFWYYLLLLFRLCWFIDLVLVRFYGNIINEWKCYIANRCGALIQKKKIMKIWCLQLMLAFLEKWHCRKYNANEQMLLLIFHIYQAPKICTEINCFTLSLLK